tara:strand:- start:99 stop:515 length:417 start_codon:yes stop_codon:yes gene_type:complete
MGLDMYAFKHKGEQFKPNENREDRRTEIVDIANWRKHNRLQGFMQELWEAKTSEEDKLHNIGWNMFNCVPLYLSKEDLDMLEEQVRTRTLPETGGFFFGEDSYTCGEQEDLKAYDLKFCKEAKEAISQGWKVFYECWW